MRGKVVKGIGGFYFVRDDESGQVFMGKARGRFKRGKNILFVGDHVEFELDEAGNSVITDVEARKNCLSRPPVSNLDVLIVTFAAAEPEPSFVTIDKLCVGAEGAGLDVVIAVNKTDQVRRERLKEISDIYSGIYPVCPVNGKTGEGTDKLLQEISGKSAAFAGQSGVGKSTLINRIAGSESAETGSISQKTGRGKHTTRHVEIFGFPDGTDVYDTPGFTSLDAPRLNRQNVRDFFPEMNRYRGLCRYLDCVHINEPDCAVKEALQNGEISESRYNSYLQIMKEVSEWRK